MRNHFLLLIVFVLTACGDQSSTPVPQPVPSPRISCIRKSTPEMHRSTRLIVGLPQAVVGQGRVHLRNEQSGAVVTVTSTAEGTFSAILEATTEDPIWAQFETNDGLSEEVLLSVRAQGESPQLSVLNVNGPGPVSSPDNDGFVVVSNQGQPSDQRYFEATPGSEAIVVNANTSAVVTVTVDDQGIMEARLQAQQQDLIHIMLVDAQTQTYSSDYLSYEVP